MLMPYGQKMREGHISIDIYALRAKEKSSFLKRKIVFLEKKNLLT